jgi:hypothetical protein
VWRWPPPSWPLLTGWRKGDGDLDLIGYRTTDPNRTLNLYRNDLPAPAQPVSFSGGAWLGYVPIRMPDTIGVQERLQPGTAAVLINRNHTYTDLVLPIDAQQKKLVGVDDRSIGEIAPVHAHDTARPLRAALVVRSAFDRRGCIAITGVRLG